MSPPSGKKTERTPSDADGYRRIWDAVAAIPHGCVLNYGAVARLAGLPGRARMVGQAPGRAPNKMQLPWHRVAAAPGRIRFPAGSSKGKTQRGLLGAEGVVFEDDRIDMVRLSPERAIDRMLWGPGEDEGS